MLKGVMDDSAKWASIDKLSAVKHKINLSSNSKAFEFKVIDKIPLSNRNYRHHEGNYCSRPPEI